jgi:NosR/NirI family transcriptional regulator, nitrous oxide reductase regulator
MHIDEPIRMVKVPWSKAVLSPPKWVSVVAWSLVGLVVCVRGHGDHGRAVKRAPTVTQVAEWFPEAHAVAYDPQGKGYVVRDAQGHALGKVIDSVDLSPSYIGYGGEIPVRVVLDRTEKIMGIALGPNNETRSYLASLKKRGFLDRWRGLTVQEAVEREVITVSGATLSSRAIGRTLRHSLVNAYGLDLPPDMQALSRVSLFSPAKVAMYVLILTSVLVTVKPSVLGGYRRALLLADVIVIGCLNGTMLSLSQMKNSLAGGIVSAEHLPLVCLLAVAVLVPLLAKKNIYCAWLCPFGAAQELIGQTAGSRRPLSARIRHLLHVCRRALLVAVGFALLAGINFDLASVEPFAVFSIKAASAWVLFLAGACLLVSVFHPRLWCRFLCPTGWTINLFRWGILKGKRYLEYESLMR